MAKKDEILVFTMKTCAYCVEVKEELNKNDIKYKEIDISNQNKKWMEISTLTGMPNTPTVYYKDTIFVPGRDFGNPQQIVNIIKTFEPIKVNEIQQLTERLKTFNYYTSVAFSNTDKILQKIEKNYRELFEDEETKTE